MRSVRRSAVAALTLAVVAAISSAAIQSSAYGAGSVTATFTKTSDWGTGYEARYTIVNGTSTATSSWNLQFDLPSGQHVSSIWSDPYTTSGQHVTITNASWDGAIAAGASFNVGFDIAYSGTYADPTNCTINGGSCAGGGTGGDTAAPSAPASLHVTGVTTTTVALAWTASTDNVGVTGYDVYRGSTKVGSASGTSYTDSGLTASTTYSYTVKAHDAAGNVSGASNAVSATTSANTDTTAPSAPGSLHSTGVTASSVSLAWNASTDNVGVTGYDVYRGSTKVGTVPGTSYTDTGLTASTTYSYTVKAHDAAGNVSAASNAVSVTTSASGGDTTAPSAPANLHVTATSSSSISLAWNASTDNVGVTGYDVYRGSTKVGTVTGTSYTDTGLSASTTYSYTVKAHDAAGNVSAASNSISQATQAGGGGGSYVRSAYFAQWGVYQRAYYPKNIITSGTASKINIINYAFENIDPTNYTCFETIKAADTNDSDPNAGDGAGDAFADYQKSYDASTSVDGVADTWDQPLKGNFNQLKKLKALYPNLKILVSIGGWTYSKYFSDAASTAARRQAFAASCINMFIKGNLPTGIGGDPSGGAGAAAGVFDGIDLDWEYPASNGGHVGNHYSPSDKANFTALAAEFRSQLDAYGTTTGKHYLLTSFMTADPAKVAVGFDVPGLMSSLDYASIQGYDMHGAWETTTNHQSSLYVPPGDPSPSTSRFSVDGAIQTWVNAGAPKSKLLMGVPFYGRGWTGVTNANNGLFQTATGPAPGTYEAGIEDYKVLKNLGYPVYRDNADGVAWLFNGSTFWTYDDPTALGQKMAYLKSMGLGGVMIWELDGDDATGSLINAVNSGL
jgi:chitinase